MSFIKKPFIAKKLRTIISIVFFVGAVFAVHTAAQAATLSISPSGGNIGVGKTITVRAVVDSGGQSINAISGAIHFSSDTLYLERVSKTNSIVTLWAQGPSYSNPNSSAAFQGVVLNGYTGSGTVLTFTFKARAEGPATISFTDGSSSVLLNDGQGTNVLTGTSGASFTVVKEATVTQPAPVEVTAPVATPTPIAVTTVAPVFTDYQSPLSAGNFVVAKGTATPQSTVTITLTSVGTNSDTSVTQTIVATAANGVFEYISDQKVTEGSSYTLVATGTDGQQTAPLTLSVKNSLLFMIKAWIMMIFAIKISLWSILIFVIIVIIQFYHNRVIKKRLAMTLEKLQQVEFRPK